VARAHALERSTHRMSKYNVYVHTATHAGHTRIAFDYEKVHA